MKQNSGKKNQEGSVMVVALILLVVLTLLGITISTISEVEIQIAGNERLYKENVYRAEAAVMECAQRMQEAASLDAGALTWMNTKGSVTSANVRSDTWWNDTNSAVVNAAVDPDGDTRYLAVEEGVAEGTSLDMTKTPLRSYSIYGRRYDSANASRGRSVVRIGFRKAM
jgi:type IV pilus assembly protein PilX